MNSVRVYRVSSSVLIPMCTAFLIMTGVFLGFVFVSRASQPAALLLPCAPLAFLCLMLARLACYRLCVDEAGFEYHDLLGRSFQARYSDVASLTQKTINLGRGSYARATLHLRDGKRFRMNLFPFGRAVYPLLQGRIQDARRSQSR